jgi:hypothetical protein
METQENEITKLKLQMEQLLLENDELKTKLKKYTTNPSFKNYYKQNKDIVQETQRKYRDKLLSEDPERLKEYQRKASKKYYEKKKQQKLSTQQNLENKNTEFILEETK